MKAYILVLVLVTVLVISILAEAMLLGYRQRSAQIQKLAQKEEMLFYLEENEAYLLTNFSTLVESTNLVESRNLPNGAELKLSYSAVKSVRTFERSNFEGDFEKARILGILIPSQTQTETEAPSEWDTDLTRRLKGDWLYIHQGITNERSGSPWGIEKISLYRKMRGSARFILEAKAFSGY
ncbi:MAG: hypothetical protein JNM63_05570 [Spirochaetia bacterium]|nr:hypothetical protein [Spirochaetia bacterium]